ncbi:MAG: hypothetical protein NVS3B10_19840 [Polyangiales bacterium]
MYRQNVAPAQPTPIDATRQAVKNCAHIQIGVAIMNAFSLTMLAVQFFFYKPPPALDIPLETVHEWRLTAMLVGVSYVVVFGAWGLLNAWGLGKRSRAARWSSLGFAAGSIVSCYAWPFGGFLLYMLLRRDVKAYFD